MLTCRDIAQLKASDYLEQQLSLRERADFYLHLFLCGPCRRFIRQMKLLRGVLARHETPVDEQTVQAVASRLHEAHQHRGHSH